MELIESGMLSDFPYAIVRSHIGFLCGYIGVPTGHPWYGLHYDDVPCDIHGGWTYSESSHYGDINSIDYLRRKIAEITKDSIDNPHSETILKHYERMLDEHISKSTEPRDYPIPFEGAVWWLGFDCGHYDDAPDPEWLANKEEPERSLYSGMYKWGTFRNRDYVFHELEGAVTEAYEAMRSKHANNT